MGQLCFPVSFVLIGINTPVIAAEPARQCIYVEQGKPSKADAQPRPLFERMKRDAAARMFDRLPVWKVSRRGRGMRG
jgi:DNA invertase Pin-like site-specific DNA recombinase